MFGVPAIAPEKTEVTIKDVVDRVTELLDGDEKNIRISVHQAPVEVFEHLKYVNVTSSEDIGRTWLNGQLELGDHRVDFYSVDLPQKPQHIDVSGSFDTEEVPAT